MDIETLAANSLLPDSLAVSGLVYDVSSGRAELVERRAPLPPAVSDLNNAKAYDVRFPLDAGHCMCHVVGVIFDSDRFWQVLELGDPRFDGWVFCGVKTTGIYCRPSCPARTPKRENVRFFASAAAAQSAGFRACKRCRPDATPGSPDWDLRADLVGRAMRLIADGVVDREGVGGLAGRLGYTERHVHRQLVAVVGAGPLALARAQRAQTARLLLETTAVSITGVAFAAGFQSVRQFNATIQEVFALTPSDLRTRARRDGRSEDSGCVSLRLPYRAPLDGDGIISFLGLRAVPGVEEVLDGAYRRSLRLPHGTGVVELRPADGHVHARYWLEDLRDLAAAMQRSRALLDLDSDPHSVAEALGDDALLGALVRAHAGATGGGSRRRPRARRARRARSAGLAAWSLHARGPPGFLLRGAAATSDRCRHPHISVRRGAGPSRSGSPGDAARAQASTGRSRPGARRATSSCSTRAPIARMRAAGCSRCRGSVRGPPST